MQGKLIIISAPSGTGKSTLIQHLMKHLSGLRFSISATSRLPRGNEKNGVDYFFLSPEQFKERIAAGDFLEYVEVYEGRYYGTLKSQVDRQLAAGEHVVCDVDVLGAKRIKQLYGDQALSIFIQPPSIDILRQRLEQRGTDSPEVIKSRLERAAYELSFAKGFDTIVVNDSLSEAQATLLEVVSHFLAS